MSDSTSTLNQFGQSVLQSIF